MKNIISKLTSVILISFIISSCFGSTQHPKINKCDIACEYLSSLTGKDGNQGCEESRPFKLPDGSIQSCERLCYTLQTEEMREISSCWLTTQNCEEIETKCRNLKLY
jgi:hypothetical protein